MANNATTPETFMISTEQSHRYVYSPSSSSRLAGSSVSYPPANQPVQQTTFVIWETWNFTVQSDISWTGMQGWIQDLPKGSGHVSKTCTCASRVYNAVLGVRPCWGSEGQSLSKAESLLSIFIQKRGQKLRI